MKLNPYLNFGGTCREAFQHYEKLLGGKIAFLHTFGEAPAEMQMPADWRDKVMHATLTVGDNVLMGSDAPPGRHEKMQGVSVSLNVDTPDEAERIWKGLEQGAQVMMPLQQTFWAQRFGMLTDRFGTPWMINCEAKQ
jgi:PhnB protein